MILLYFLICILLTPIFLVYLLLCIASPILTFRLKKRGKGNIIYISKDCIHSDYVFKANQVSNIFPITSGFMKIGWGDRKVFLETRRWKELKLKTFLTAFFGLNESVLRTEQIYRVPEGARAVELDDEQLRKVIDHIKNSFNGEKVVKSPSDYEKGDYYHSNLNYNCITNCNNWVNRGLLIGRASNKLWCPLSMYV